MQIEKLQSLLLDKTVEIQRQGLVLFESFDFEKQNEVGFSFLLTSAFEEVRQAGLTLLSSLDSEQEKQCWETIFKSITVAHDGTPEAPLGWVWNTTLLEYFLSNVGTTLKGLRLSTLCRDASDLGNLSWLQHCPILTHIDLNTVTISNEGLAQLIQHPTLDYFELALCSLDENDYQSLKDAKPESTIVKTEDKVGYVFQYDDGGRGCRITGALYPKHRNGKLIGVLASVQGYSGGGCQSYWNGASIVSDDSVQWVWNHWTDAPTHANNLSADGEMLEETPFKPSEYPGHIVIDEEGWGQETTPVLKELYECMWNHLEYDDDRDWEDLTEETKSMVVEKGGFHYTSGLYCPALLIAGQSGGLLTSWGFGNIDLPKARKAIAPGLPTFTKDGSVPKYRMVLRVSIYGSTLYNDLEDQIYEEETAPQAYEAFQKDLVERVLPKFVNNGFELITTEIDMDYEAIIFIVHSPKSMVELDKLFIKITADIDTDITVYDLEGLVTQCYTCGDYDSGTIGLCSDDLTYYIKDSQHMLTKYEETFSSSNS